LDDEPFAEITKRLHHRPSWEHRYRIRCAHITGARPAGISSDNPSQRVHISHHASLRAVAARHGESDPVGDPNDIAGKREGIWCPADWLVVNQAKRAWVDLKEMTGHRHRARGPRRHPNASTTYGHGLRNGGEPHADHAPRAFALPTGLVEAAGNAYRIARTEATAQPVNTTSATAPKRRLRID
jgi:hypothetical protein